ncbi:MAG: hypothetical protein V3T83_07435 [Acidobacteriota bacterium]
MRAFPWDANAYASHTTDDDARRALRPRADAIVPNTVPTRRRMGLIWADSG